MLTRQAERHANRPLVSAGDTTWSYADACDTAARFAGALRGAGIKAGDRVAVICSNRIEFLEIVLGCAWLGAVAVPINVASRGPQLQHILSNCGARLLVIEDVLCRQSRAARRRRARVEAIWLIGAKQTFGLGNVRRDPDAARRRAHRGGGGPARRPRPDPLHLRHHRPVEGRLLPARAIFLVGGQHGVAPATARRRRALHQPAAVSHQRAQHLLSSAADRRLRALREAVLRLRLFSVAGAEPRHRHLSARRHGADPAVAAGVARRRPRIRSALRSRPACRRSFTPSSRGAPASACSTAGARPKPISCSARRSSTSSPD